MNFNISEPGFDIKFYLKIGIAILIHNWVLNKNLE